MDNEVKEDDWFKKNGCRNNQIKKNAQFRPNTFYS